VGARVIHRRHIGVNHRPHLAEDGLGQIGLVAGQQPVGVAPDRLTGRHRQPLDALAQRLGRRQPVESQHPGEIGIPGIFADGVEGRFAATDQPDHGFGQVGVGDAVAARGARPQGFQVAFEDRIIQVLANEGKPGVGGNGRRGQFNVEIHKQNFFMRASPNR